MRILHNNTSLLLVTALLSISISGCYTLLKHPGISDDIQTADFNNCSDCHEGHPYIGPYDPVYTGTWRDYYVVPWWHRGVFTTDVDQLYEESLVNEREIDDRQIREGSSDIKSGRAAPSPGAKREESVRPSERSSEEGTTAKKDKKVSRERKAGKGPDKNQAEDDKKKDSAGSKKKSEEGKKKQ